MAPEYCACGHYRFAHAESAGRCDNCRCETYSPKPAPPQWRCVCGHTVEDHGDRPPLWPGKPLWPCLSCDVCEDFVEDLTDLEEDS